MYSVGEEFEIILDDTPEYFTCLANIIIKGKEYIISENEEGTKGYSYLTLTRMK